MVASGATMTYSSHRKAGFTLSELLMVMMVITILYCISLSVIRAVSRSANKTAARAELKSIETAVKQYYAHYQVWPELPEGQDGDLDPPIDAKLAAILTGTNDDRDAIGRNPDKIIFIEFARQDSDGTPYNPWGASGRFEKEKCRYHLDVDSDFNNYIEPSLPDKVKGSSATGLQSDGRRPGSVAVWTLNPEVAVPSSGSDDAIREYLLGSWQ